MGEYTVKEIVNDKIESYVLTDDQLITVQHGETAQVKIKNKKIRGNVEITKKSNDNTDVGLFMGLLALSGTGLAGIYLYKRRKMKKS